MERDANYAAVGAFVLLVALLGALFVYWYSDSREHRDYNRYEIYFTGSVSGLDRGSSVRYLGVGVGRVVDMRIDPRDSGRVEVTVDIDSTTPISEHTVAELQLQGVTGLLYIDLREDRTNKTMAPAVEGLQVPGDPLGAVALRCVSLEPAAAGGRHRRRGQTRRPPARRCQSQRGHERARQRRPGKPQAAADRARPERAGGGVARRDGGAQRLGEGCARRDRRRGTGRAGGRAAAAWHLRPSGERQRSAGPGDRRQPPGPACLHARWLAGDRALRARRQGRGRGHSCARREPARESRAAVVSTAKRGVEIPR